MSGFIKGLYRQTKLNYGIPPAYNKDIISNTKSVRMCLYKKRDYH